MLLQQCLPFTVLKPEESEMASSLVEKLLQQCLPFTVLKLKSIQGGNNEKDIVATVLTVYGIETISRLKMLIRSGIVATVLTVYGIETPSYEL